MYSPVLSPESIMSLWNEDVFERIAASTNLTERTVAACRDVLVSGVTGQEAASRHKFFPAHISRSISLLRSKQSEMVESAEALKDHDALFKYTAVQVAKAMAGAELKVEEPAPGKTYEGSVLVVTHGYLVQKISRGSVVAHDIGKLERTPAANASVAITYPHDGHKAAVSVIDPVQEKGRGR